MVNSAFVGRHGRAGILVWFILALAVSASCQRPVTPISQGWVGKRVFVKPGTVLQPGTPMAGAKKSENAAPGGSGRLGAIYRVERAGGSWLAIQDENRGTAGWAPVESVILLDQAHDYFTREIQAKPNNAAGYIGRGRLWWDKKEYDKAIRDYDAAIRLDPENASAYDGRGAVWYANNEYDKAIADFGEAIRLDAKDAFAYRCRGTAGASSRSTTRRSPTSTRPSDSNQIMR